MTVPSSNHTTPPDQDGLPHLLVCSHARTYRDADEYLHCLACHTLLGVPPAHEAYLGAPPRPPSLWLVLGLVTILILSTALMVTHPVWWVLVGGGGAVACALGGLVGLLCSVGGGE